ncbi:MAG: N-acetylmuramoyl-L-alanine amidase family protein [Gemmatimonadaceae bacterium]
MRLSPPVRHVPAALAAAVTACLIATGVACAPRSINTVDGGGGDVPSLPPIPRVDGPLQVRVVYPARGALVTSRDSNFIFGSLGNGGATLHINGAPVAVEPNGSFLAWLPVPSEPRYLLQATLDGRAVTDTLPIRLLPRPVALAATGPLVVDDRSLTPSGPVSYPADEPVRVSVRAPATARVALVLAGGAEGGPPVPLAVVPGSTDRRPDDAGALWAADVAAGRLAGGARLVAVRGPDSVTVPLPTVTILQPSLVQVGEPEAADSGDRRISARPLPGGTYRWFLVPGTLMERTARVGDFVRLELARGLDAWVAAADVRPLPAGAVPPRRTVGNLRVVPADDWVDVVFPMADVPPYRVDEEGGTIVLTLYGTTPNTDIITYSANDSLVRHLTWEPLPDGRARYTLHLAGRPFGYLAFWRGDAFVLRVRRPPTVDAAAPLRGLRIAVDAGHPPIGATGPTGLYEAEATLAVSDRLRAELERRGATVLMTRTSMDPVALGDRPIIARRGAAHALVSVHLNALPDGVNPFTAHGTGTYYFHPQAEPLARAIQRALVRWMGLPNLGIHYDNLALARPTWMPAILAEGAFLMMPAQEAALRTPDFQQAYASGLADGLEAYFRTLAGAP